MLERHRRSARWHVEVARCTGTAPSSDLVLHGHHHEAVVDALAVHVHTKPEEIVGISVLADKVTASGNGIIARVAESLTGSKGAVGDAVPSGVVGSLVVLRHLGTVDAHIGTNLTSGIIRVVRSEIAGKEFTRLGEDGASVAGVLDVARLCDGCIHVGIARRAENRLVGLCKRKGSAQSETKNH